MTENSKVQLALGTAMWGWTIDKNMAFALLSNFYESGFRILDAATNYPINKQPQDFRKAENIILEWINAHGVQDLQMIMKIGSVNNLKSPDNNLNPSFLLMCLDEYGHKFGTNLWSVMIHWDNREEVSAVSATLEILAYAARMGYQPGLSGIKYPAVYFQANKDSNLDFIIQIKHNLLQSDYARYDAFQGTKRFWAYGINGGGIKTKGTDYHDQSSLVVRGGQTLTPGLFELVEKELVGKDERLRSIFDVNLLYALKSPDIAGILAGPSTVSQWRYTLAGYHNLCASDTTDLYNRLLAIKAGYDGK